MLWFAAIACEFSPTSSCYWVGYDITAAVLALRMSIFLAQRNLFACLRIWHIENTFRFHFLRARKIKVSITFKVFHSRLIGLAET